MIEKIAILYTGRAGGLNYYNYNLCRAICEYTRPTIIISSQNVLYEDYSKLNCNLVHYDTYNNKISFIFNTFFLRNFLKFSDYILSQNFDYIIDTGSMVLGQLIKKRCLSTKFITVIHDTNLKKEYTTRLLILFRMYSIDYSNSVAFIVLSEYDKNQLKKLTTKKIIVSVPGFSHAPEYISKYNHSNKSFLFFGRIEKYKNIDLLVPAFINAKKIRPEIRLTIIGSGRINKKTLKLIESEPSIFLLHRWIGDHEIIEAFKNHGIVILPYTEGPASAVIATANAYNCLPIASNLGAFREYVTDGFDGLLIEPNLMGISESIIRISGSPELYNQIINNIATKDYSSRLWKNIAKKLIENINCVT